MQACIHRLVFVEVFLKFNTNFWIFHLVLQEFKSGTYMKNISMSTKQYKTVDEPILQYIPFKPDAPQPKPAKVAPPPSPSKFVRKEFVHSDYESSDYDSKLAPTWRPSDSDTEQRGYKPVRPVLTPTGRSSRHSDGPSPAPPSVFDNPPQFSGPPRPKFQPIDKFKTDTYTEKQQVFKPKPVAAKPLFQDSRNESKQSTNYSFSQTGPKSTRFYTGIAGQPIHNAIATETSNSMHMKETTEKSNRIVNYTQTRRIISLDDNQIKKNDVPLEPFPYTPEPVHYRPSVRAHPTPTPTRFVPGEYRESDYESEVENARIRPLWTPNPSDSDEPQYRRVRPLLQTRSTSVPRSYERVMTPMEFDNNPVMMPSKIYVEPITTQNKTQTLNRYSSTTKKVQDTKTSRDDMSVRSHSVGYNNNYTPPQNTMQRATHQVDGMNAQLKTKAHQFMQDVIQDVKKIQKPILKKSVSINDDSNPHAYRDESRVSEYGKFIVDVYFGLFFKI
jgi:titin